MAAFVRFFDQYRTPEFASAGFVPDETITIPEGPLDAEFIHSMEPMLRKLGMPVLLQKGIITVLSEYAICKAGKPITPEQSRLLVSTFCRMLMVHVDTISQMKIIIAVDFCLNRNSLVTNWMNSR